MILDSPSLIQLAVGVDRAIPQADDAQVVVPSIIHPVIEPRVQGVTFLAGGTGVRSTQSAITILQSTRTNIASQVSNIVILEKGYWELILQVAYRTNFTTLPQANPDLAVRITQVGSGLSMHMLPLFAAVGANFSVEKQLRFLLNGDYQIDALFGLTGVGQTMDTNVSIYSTRLM